jgi:GNAT superfamily N-acetyltransferase
MQDVEIIDLTPETIGAYGVCGYKDAQKHAELRRKIDWFRRHYPLGLRIKVLSSKSAGCQGMLEYIPGEYAHRPVDAAGYLFIHCLFVGFRKEFKGRGYASSMIDACIAEARQAGMRGVAVVTRNGPFMAKRDIFLKKGFAVTDTASPDFELLAVKFDDTAPDPTFRPSLTDNPQQYADGLTIIRSAQCPYSVKNVEAIITTARETFGMTPVLVDLEDAADAQHTPCAFGTFCIIYDGKVISHHPISRARFETIISKMKR